MSGIIETKNAIIDSVSLSNADHGVLSAWVSLNYGGEKQGFGGYALYNPKIQTEGNYCGLFIWRVLEIADVKSWDRLVGKAVRAKADLSKVYAIGHILKDDWFDIEEEFNVLHMGIKG